MQCTGENDMRRAGEVVASWLQEGDGGRVRGYRDRAGNSGTSGLDLSPDFLWFIHF